MKFSIDTLKYQNISSGVPSPKILLKFVNLSLQVSQKESLLLCCLLRILKSIILHFTHSSCLLVLLLLLRCPLVRLRACR